MEAQGVEAQVSTVSAAEPQEEEVFDSEEEHEVEMIVLEVDLGLRCRRRCPNFKFHFAQPIG